MKILTIKELAYLCMQEIENGNGDKKILLSDDDEGNGYHGLFYHFTPIDKTYLGYTHSSLGINEKNIDEYIILG